MTRVKICGITRHDDARLACELGASALGFVFWPASPRFIDPYRARDIIRSLPPLVSTVGVFVDQPLEYVEGVASLARLAAVQLHGSEPPEFCARVRHGVIKAIAVRGAADAAAIAAWPSRVRVLLDAHDPVQRGGTGRVIDWSVARQAAAARPIILSGGLRPDNIVDALEQVRPYAVDVSSGVEQAPGVKSHDRLRELFAAIRGALGEPA